MDLCAPSLAAVGLGSLRARVNAVRTSLGRCFECAITTRRLWVTLTCFTLSKGGVEFTGKRGEKPE